MDNFLMSFIMMIIWSTIFAALFVLARKIKLLRSNFGITASIVACICLYIRMIIPFDLGFFRIVFIRWEWFCQWYDRINLARYQILAGELTITQILFAVWLTVAAVKLIRWGVRYVKVYCAIETTPDDVTEKLEKILARVQMSQGNCKKIRVVRCPIAHSPMGIGLFRRYILLPEEEYTQEELYYIVLHEIIHFKNGDLWLMFVSNLMCCIFWWNPLIYMMAKEIEYAFEIRCDIKATNGMSNEKRAAYLETVLKILKVRPKMTLKPKKHRRIRGNAAGFAQSRYEAAIRERFIAVRDREKSFGKRRSLSALWLGLMALLMVLSYMFVFFPYHEVEESDMDGGIMVESEDDMWVELSEDGTWRFYMQTEDQLICNIIEEESVAQLQKDLEVEIR